LHALFIDGVLIPASELVNQTTITQVGSLKEIEYFHVEVDTHDILLAENTPAESFVDDDSRGMFHNASEWWANNADLSRVPAIYCAPRVTDGYELEAVRNRINARAKSQLASEGEFAA
jgi:hypothetical protein